jgi:hypothetical protein
MSQVITYPSSFTITEVKVNKEKTSAKVGISLKNVTREAGVAITGLSVNSLLHGSPIRAKGRQVLLAVNGDPNLTDVNTAATLLGKTKQLSLLVCEQHETYNSSSSCLQIVAAPFFKHNPGVCFSSTRGRTLVTISKIFKSGPFAGNPYLRVGDLVLAVNGIPVSKPEQADQALHSPIGTDEPVTVLHVVDVLYFRALIFGSIDSKLAVKRDKNDPERYILMAQRSGGSTTPLPLQHHPETQQLYDPSPYQKLVAPADSTTWDFKNPKGFFKSWYQKVLAFLEKYNERIEEALDPLEDLACEHSWRHANSYTNPPIPSSRAPLRPTTSSSSTATTNRPPQRPPDLVLEAQHVCVPPPKSPVVSKPPPPQGDFISC